MREQISQRTQILAGIAVLLLSVGGAIVAEQLGRLSPSLALLAVGWGAVSAGIMLAVGASVVWALTPLAGEREQHASATAQGGDITQVRHTRMGNDADDG